MKKMLLLLSLIAVPAWAGDAAAPAAVVSPDPKLEAMQTETVAVTSVVIELNGSAKSVSALVAALEKDALYKEAACSGKPIKKRAKKSAGTARIMCAKADGRLMEFLIKNNPATVRWSISISPVTTRVCPAGCVVMPCPLINRCCSTTTHQPC